MPSPHHTVGDSPLLLRVSSPAGSWLSSRDAQQFLWAVKEVRKIVSRSPLNRKEEDEILPGSTLSDAEILQYVRIFFF